jgi:superoxide dismutase, Fe-Mn family
MFYPTWSIEWLKHSVLCSTHLCRKWIQRQLSICSSKKTSQTLQQMDQEFEQIEKIATSSHVDPYTFYSCYHHLMHTQKQLIQWMDHIDIQRVESSSMIEHPQQDDMKTDQLRSVPIGKHQLPPLPYPYNALEPYIDEKTMRIHHDEHHQSYVDGLNQAEIMMQRARQQGNFQLIKHWEREAAFNGAGHYLHTIFWEIMSPKGGGKPTGSLLKQIEKDFGSYQSFKKHFSAAAEKVEGGGWAILVWSPRAGRLEILQAEKHQNLSQWDVIPLLPLDVWEHAYYLKYPNKRKKYIEAWWHVVNWPAVQQRWEQAQRIRWQPY